MMVLVCDVLLSAERETPRPLGAAAVYCPERRSAEARSLEVAADQRQSWTNMENVSLKEEKFNGRK